MATEMQTVSRRKRLTKAKPSKLEMLRTVAIVVGIAVIQAPALADSPEPNAILLGLGGHSPVSYFDEDGPRYGTPQYRATHDGVTYLFASEAELGKFKANPQKYIPAYGGWCAYGMAVEGKFDADPTNYEIIDDKLHVFLRNDEVDTRQLWNEGDVSALRAKADGFWAKLSDLRSRAYLNSHNVGASGIAIDGYSPVSYFTKDRAERGDPEFAVEHGGITYLLTSQAQVSRFEGYPDKYVPAYGGWCAFGMAVEDKFPVDPTNFKIVDGRLMLFLRNEKIDALELWNKAAESEYISKADAHWSKVSQ